MPVALVIDEDLGGDVGWGTAVCVGSLTNGLEHLCEPKVDEFDVSSLCHGHNDVLWFEVPVNDVLIMTILDRINHGRGVLSRFQLREVVLLQNLVKQLATFHELHDEAPEPLVLIYIEEFNNIWVVNLLQDVDFHLNRDLILLRHLFL